MEFFSENLKEYLLSILTYNLKKVLRRICEKLKTSYCFLISNFFSFWGSKVNLNKWKLQKIDIITKSILEKWSIRLLEQNCFKPFNLFLYAIQNFCIIYLCLWKYNAVSVNDIPSFNAWESEVLDFWPWLVTRAWGGGEIVNFMIREA